MKKFYITLLLNIALTAVLSAQNVLLETSFEGPGFDEGWIIGVSQGIDIPPQDYPANFQEWEKWDITETTQFGYVHSGDSAAWIGGTAMPEPKHDWLVSPLITMPEDADIVLSYWLWYHSENVYVTRFSIMIYDNETETWEEAYLLANDFNSPYHYIEEYKLDMNPWKGKEIKIAFVKNGTYQMAMDDVKILCYNYNDVEETVSDSRINIYPNPANNVLNVKIDNYESDDMITIMDVSGRTLISETITNDQVKVDLSSLSKGLYIIKVGDVVDKIVIE